MAWRWLNGYEVVLNPMREPNENDCLSRSATARLSWISWLLVVAIVLRCAWLPFHLAADHHSDDQGMGVALVHVDVSADHDHDTAPNELGTEGDRHDHDDHGPPHSPHPAMAHKAPLARVAAAANCLKPIGDVAALSADVRELPLQPSPGRPPEARSTGPPDYSSHSPRLPRAPPSAS